mmetsp:Transcript_25675/g.81030  ORF Transcript_25675/g.81030 Transcript_25675/m.81030 type:complete len:230 (-) Transcript_25675:103-792(-)
MLPSQAGPKPKTEMLSQTWRAKTKAFKPAVALKLMVSAMPECTWSMMTVFLPQPLKVFCPLPRQSRPWGLQFGVQPLGFRQQNLPQPTAGSCRKVQIGRAFSSFGMLPKRFTKRTSVLSPTCFARSGMLAPEGAALMRITASWLSMSSPHFSFSKCWEEPTRAHESLGLMQCEWSPWRNLRGVAPLQSVWLMSVQLPSSVCTLCVQISGGPDPQAVSCRTGSGPRGATA